MDKLGVLCKVRVSETGLVGGHGSQLQKPVKSRIDWGAADVSIAPWQQCSVSQDYWKPMKIVQ